MMITLDKVSHPLGLPAVMVAIVAAFHLTLLGLGVTLKEAQDAGWAMQAPVSQFLSWDGCVRKCIAHVRFAAWLCMPAWPWGMAGVVGLLAWEWCSTCCMS